MTVALFSSATGSDNLHDGSPAAANVPYLANAAGTKPPNYLIAVWPPLAQGVVKIGQGFSKRPPRGGFTRLDCAATDGTIEFESERPLALREAPLLDRTEIEKAAHLCEPFQNGRETGRLLHDIGAMISLLDPAMLAEPILDFGAGTGWITETVARMGYAVTAFDIHGDLAACIEGRANADSRVDPALISVATGDGHAMPFEEGSFGHLLCFDTLHHMHDYDKVFSEFARVLKPGGRAIFVEPGARHSTSPETIAFMKQMAHDPTWIERDVVLEDIDAISRRSGLSGLTIVPLQHPSQFSTFSLKRWQGFRRGSLRERFRFGAQLARTNYYERVIFFCSKTT